MTLPPSDRAMEASREQEWIEIDSRRRCDRSIPLGVSECVGEMFKFGRSKLRLDG